MRFKREDTDGLPAPSLPFLADTALFFVNIEEHSSLSILLPSLL